MNGRAESHADARLLRVLLDVSESPVFVGPNGEVSMTIFSLVLFAHIVATLGLFASVAIEWLILLALRRTPTQSEVRMWSELWPKLLPLGSTSAMLLIISGIYLATAGAAWSQGWIQVSLVSLLLIAPLGALAGRRVSAIHRGGNARESDLAVLGMFISYRTAIALGVVMLMTIKPKLTESLAVVVIALAGGLVSGVAIRNGHVATSKYETRPLGEQ